MKIAILGGTGSIGEGFALRWAGKHDILVCSREIERAEKAAYEYTCELTTRGLYCLGIKGCENVTAIEQADIILLSVPYQGVVQLLKSLYPYFKDQIVVSMIVPMKKNSEFEYTPPKQGSAALELQEILPKSVKVVSAFHNVSAKKLANIGLELDYDVVVCSDNEQAKKTVMELALEIKNLRPFDGGGLASSSMIEALTPFLINLAKRNGLSDLSVKFV